MNTSTAPLVKKGHAEVGATRDKKQPVKLYYQVTGTGPKKIVLVMGLNTSGVASWEPIVEIFEHKPEYSVLVFDNRGVGRSEAPKGMYSTSQMAQDTLDLLDHLGWKENIHLVGVSLGGMISLEMVSADTKRFGSLILTSTTARGRSLPQLVTVNFLTKALMEKDSGKRMGLAAKVLYPPEWLSAPSKDPAYETNEAKVVADMTRRVNNTPAQPLNGNIGQTYAAMTHHVSNDRLHAIKDSGLPVLVLTGTVDNFVRPSGSYHLQKELQCKMVVFEGSGHSLPGEKSEHFVRYMEEIISRGKEGDFSL